MEIIVFEKAAYYKMLEEMKQTVLAAIHEGNRQVKQPQLPQELEWITAAQAMDILKCGRIRLRKLREDNEITSSPQGIHFLYLKASLFDHLARYGS